MSFVTDKKCIIKIVVVGWFLVLNGTLQQYFSYILYLEKTTDLSQVTDKLYHIMFNVVSSIPRHERGLNSQHQW